MFESIKNLRKNSEKISIFFISATAGSNSRKVKAIQYFSNLFSQINADETIGKASLCTKLKILLIKLTIFLKSLKYIYYLL